MEMKKEAPELKQNGTENFYSTIGYMYLNLCNVLKGGFIEAHCFP